MIVASIDSYLKVDNLIACHISNCKANGFSSKIHNIKYTMLYLWVGGVGPALTNKLHDEQLQRKIYWLMSDRETCNGLFATRKLL